MPDLPGRSGMGLLRGHLVITLAGTAVAFTVTAANVDERDVVPNLYDKLRGLLIGDKGFISGELKAEAAAHDIDLQTPLRKNMPDGRDPGAVARLIRTRRAVETAIGKLSEMFAAQTTKARDLPGFVNRMARMSILPFIRAWQKWVYGSWETLPFPKSA